MYACAGPISWGALDIISGKKTVETARGGGGGGEGEGGGKTPFLEREA